MPARVPRAGDRLVEGGGIGPRAYALFARGGHRIHERLLLLHEKVLELVQLLRRQVEALEERRVMGVKLALLLDRHELLDLGVVHQRPCDRNTLLLPT